MTKHSIKKGAMRSGTNEYIPISKATKLEDYQCPSCKSKCSLRKQTEKRILHFAHHSSGECKYYDEYRKTSTSNCGGGESISHIEAKTELSNLLHEGIIINQYCAYASIRREDFYFLRKNPCRSVRFKCNETDSIRIEHRRENQIFDVAVLNNEGNLKCVFEIKNTHAQEGRPEPWFEFDAKDVLSENDNVLTCIRTDRSICSRCEDIIQREEREEEERQERERRILMLRTKKLKMRFPERGYFFTNPHDNDFDNYDVFLNVPYSAKDSIKQKGARWDPNLELWYVPALKNYCHTRISRYELILNYAYQGIVKFSSENNILSVHFDYDEDVKEYIKNNFNARWENQTKSWFFRNPINYDRIKKYFHDVGFRICTENVEEQHLNQQCTPKRKRIEPGCKKIENYFGVQSK